MDQNNGGEMNTNQNAPVSNAPVTPVSQPSPVSDGVSEHKLFAILGYILPFLFFIPIINEKSKNNAFARFHANQQLTLLAIWIGLYVLSNIFYMVLAMGIYFLMPLVNLALLVLVIMGIINAAQGEMKALPVIGGLNLLDKFFK